MSERTRDTATGAPSDCLPDLAGPDAGLPRVLERFEFAAHQDPSAAWDAFTRTWNWAAPLAIALPVTADGAGPAARAVPGGFSLSGRWRPSGDEQSGWVALPVPTEGRQGHSGTEEGARNLFVLPERTLPRALSGGSGDPRHAATFELTDVFVAAGLATRTAGTALRAEDTLFFRTAVTAMALGSARRVTDALTGLAPDARADASTAPLSPTASAVELAAVLHDERTALAAALRDLPRSGRTAPSASEEAEVTHLTRVGPMVRHVVVAAYERGLPSAGHHEGQSLVRTVEDTAPILQCMRFAVETLPPLGKTTTRKAQHGDERRISG
ncbi:hypothetical protein OG206_01340 [Streptomyces sp. NBC_01341]|uniref:hypothetical protein n=1 Tax=Streptomyces sp. NBC_01341 TaxID=2903831 RepID=UPI002E161B21|nr:hypothetical protein OG206_01340 [Streptomyces sp. NBC_01341]